MTSIIVNYIPNLPQIPFRHGVGKSEGIVMHSTAVFGDSAAGERNYECSHYENAFVHSFSDPLGTIETADPNYIAYGAGHVANQRFLHAELCQVKNDGTQAAKDLFQTSYGNWTNYAAQRLYDRKLPVKLAQLDGTGTLWQHYDVTKYLGDSNHVDPMDYLITWNITWEQVVTDVQTKYKELETMDQVLARLAALEEKVKVLDKTPAPDWFVKEFGPHVLDGIVNDLNGDVDFWRDTAIILRIKAKGL
jgi:N-acetylmuramoyl-L-alanine amidase CwlA